MRRWMALLVGCAALAFAGTALALGGALDTNEPTEETQPKVIEEEKHFEDIEFDDIPKGMLGSDELPEKEPVEKEPVDDTPPEIVILHPEDGQVFETKEVVFEGETEPGARVFAGGHEVDVTDDGAWRIVLALGKGENHITVKAKDEAGNIGTDSVTVIYKAPEPKEDPPKEDPPKDTTPPEIVILHPEDGQVFETKEVVFEGETEPGARVFVAGHEADVSESGAWRIVLALEKGENYVKAKAKDKAGNYSYDSVTVIYQPDGEEPVDWEFTAHQLYGECGEEPPYDVFYGTGKPGSLIFIESAYGGGVAEINEAGDWEIKVIFESAPVGKTFAVYVTDKFGHKQVFEFVHTG